MTRITCAFAAFLALLIVPAAYAAEFTLEKGDDGITVKLDGKVLTRYLVRSGTKPILWPLIGPSGDSITRGFPMVEATETEKADHPHHRSVWFTHGDVNGLSFWHEGDPSKPADTKPRVVHQEFLKTEAGKTAVIGTRNDWLAADGTKQCEDERIITFGTEGENVWIDFDVTVRATDRPVKFGDTKEGTFGVRVAGTMKPDAGKGGKIVNSEGDIDKGAWGKAASWVDYHGPVNGETVGIAILNHPKSFRYPTYWHVRTYGLFAANPFGLHHFKGSRSVDGSHVLQPGQSMRLLHRILLHKGDEKEGEVAKAFEKYMATLK
jgi:hypothetical protein